MHERVHEDSVAAVASSVDDGRPAPEQIIVDRIVWAVMEHRLPPGTKLPENALCETFGASRARIRRSLLMLAGRGVVVLHSNRGAFVASPSPDEARSVFAARAAVEPTIVRTVVARIVDSEIDELRDNVAREVRAAERGQRHEAISLSGRFHIRLAELGANPILSRFVEELVARTSLIIGLFGSPGISSCSETEHGALIKAIAERDADQACGQMLHHLAHIEAELTLNGKPKEAIDVRRIFGDGRRP
jgi:DNA-binding GntR family transcriptional regulator